MSKGLFIRISTVLAFLVLWMVLNFYLQSTPTFLDRPSNLSSITETIELNYVNWACDCAPFIETKYVLNDPNYETREQDCIFIESANAKLKLPDA